MTPSATGVSHSLSIGRRVGTRVPAVFDAWLDAGSIRAWMKPRSEVVVSDVQTDAVVGGRFRIVMRAHGRDECHEGVYRIIDRPHRLRFSWASPAAGPDTSVDISFLAASEDQTMVLLTHGQLNSLAAAENHREGWRRILENLARILEETSPDQHSGGQPHADEAQERR
jgi:uncharacterized protein YndB with AHSA1/START domain